MIPRISTVESLKVNSMLIGAMLQVGDCLLLQPNSNVLAVSRQLPIFWAKEGELSAYPLFTRPLPKPIITEFVQMNIENQVPLIKVRNIHVNGLSTSGTIQIGSNVHTEATTRVKHFRQFLFPPKIPPQSS